MWTSICFSVLDLDAFERTNKAEGLGMSSESTPGEKNLHDAEFICKLFRFLQLLCEGHNLGMLLWKYVCYTFPISILCLALTKNSINVKPRKLSSYNFPFFLGTAVAIGTKIYGKPSIIKKPSEN